MKKWFFGAVAIAIASLFNLSLVSANEGTVAAPCCGDILSAGDCCCASGSIYFDAEATFFRYHRADGVQDVADQIEFNFEISPRLTLGYMGCDGVGYRVRYWNYSHSAENAGGDVIDVDTYTIDAEWFTQFAVSCGTTVEFSAGIRWVDFQEVMVIGGPDENTRFSAPGGVIGLQVNQKTQFGFELYARARGSILMSDRTRDLGGVDAEVFDVTQMISEISLGVQSSYCLGNGAIATFHAGVEWQQWENFSVEQNLGGGVNDTPSDVGFGGFTLGLGLQY